MRGTRRLSRFRRNAHPSHRYGGYKARLELLDLFFTLRQAIEDRRVDRTRADRVDSDLAVFQLDRPGASERSYSSLSRTVNTHRRVCFGSSDRSS